MASVIAVHSWRIIPFATVIFLAGLASIPAEVEDAAKVDGATGLKKFWYVTLPLQLPIATVALLFGIVFTATDMTVVYILTHGGPFNSTHMLTTWAFDTGINSAALGQGAAISLYLLPVLVLVAVLMLRFARRTEVELTWPDSDATSVSWLVVGPVRDPARVPVLLDADDGAEDRRRPLQRREQPVQVRQRLADDQELRVPVHGHPVPDDGS